MSRSVTNAVSGLAQLIFTAKYWGKLAFHSSWFLVFSLLMELADMTVLEKTCIWFRSDFMTLELNSVFSSTGLFHDDHKERFLAPLAQLLFSMRDALLHIKQPY